MCYNPYVSFGTWTIGIIASLYLYSQHKSFLFPLVVSQMQLIEGLRWTGAIDERILAIAGKLALYAQPVAAFYEANKKSFILPYVIVQTITEALIGSRDLRFTVAKDGHFKWNWSFDPISLEAIPYWSGLLLGTYFILERGVGLFMLALFAYFYINHAKYGTSGSLWCVWVNLLWVFYIFK